MIDLQGFFLYKCDPDWIRTNDPQLRRLLLYPTELPDQSWAANKAFFLLIAKLFYKIIL